MLTQKIYLTLEYIPAFMLTETDVKVAQEDQMRITAMLTLVMLLGMPASSQSTPDCHSHDVDSRGDQAMGFEHTKTTHHFLLKHTGGVIRVEARDATDESSRASVRRHLAHIANAFSRGDFQIPMLVHDQTPPGAEAMKRMKNSIHYQYAEIANGAEVVISSRDPKAVAAIQKFLRFQIEDHRTGDPLHVTD